jgi:hypothetical protein
MPPWRTIKPVDDARLTTGEVSRTTKIMVTFPASWVVGCGINGGLVGGTSYHRRKYEVEGSCCESVRRLKFEWDRGSY